jgi:D-alanyl-D-alanine carboxypeptidase
MAQRAGAAMAKYQRHPVSATALIISRSDVWETVAYVTGDPQELRWTDESAPGEGSFYRWRIEDPQARTHRLQAALNRARLTAGARGAIAAVLTTNGLWVGTSGVSDSTTRAQVEPQMRFGIGSISKTFVAATVLQLVEEGRLSLDDPLRNWLPDIAHITNTISIRQLLDHTSGVYDYFDSWDWYYDAIERPERAITTEELLEYSEPGYFPPGTGFHYSNTGYLLLGMIIEKATGRTVLEEYKARFIQPLRLQSVYLSPVEPATGELIHAHGNFYNGFKNEVDISAIPGNSYYSAVWVAGGLFATIEDVARWVEALGSGSLHSPQTFAEMIRWNPVGGSEKYGLGVWSESTPKGEFYVHSGHVPGYRTFAGYSPALETTLVLFINSDAAIRPGWLALVNAL